MLWEGYEGGLETEDTHHISRWCFFSLFSTLSRALLTAASWSISRKGGLRGRVVLYDVSESRDHLALESDTSNGPMIVLFGTTLQFIGSLLTLGSPIQFNA
jgi:hypothetical protein